MAVFKKNGNWWIDCYVEGQRVRRKVGPNKRTAELAEKNLKVRAAKGEWLGIKHIRRITFETFCQEFLSKPAGRAPRTVKSYKQICNQHLIPYFGTRYLVNIRPKHVEDYVQERVGIAQPSTVNNELRRLKALLNAAVRWDYLKDSPARGVKPLPLPEKEPPYMTQDQVSELYPACRGWIHTFVAIGLNTGLRLSEILALAWEDIDLMNGVLKVRSDDAFTTKSRRNREIPINRFLHRVLNKAPRHITCPHIIFTSGGRSADPKLAHKRFKHALKCAGLPTKFRIHDMRHTFGTTLAANGVDIRTIMELMGHANIQTTQQYLHAAPNRMKGAVETLGLDGSVEADKGAEMHTGSPFLDTETSDGTGVA